MTLAASPSQISLGGSNSGTSIELEIGQLGGVYPNSGAGGGAAGSGNSPISLGDTPIWSVIGGYSSPSNISMDYLRGKSYRTAPTYSVSVNQHDVTVNLSSLPNYLAGKSDVTITIASGAYLYATATTNAALTITGASAGDTVTIVNNGYIMGMGGAGGGSSNNTGGNGGPAISLGYNVTIQNNSYIGGGGGGGGGAVAGGGGGAGGGAGGGYSGYGGSGGVPGGNGGSAGTYAPDSSDYYVGGGGGGRIMPGSGAAAWQNAGAGGGGGYYWSTIVGGNTYYNTPGGSANGAGSNFNYSGRGGYFLGGGGGGGWGASGGYGRDFNYAVYSAGNGGKAVALNGYSVTWNTYGTVYGAVS